jgi:DNA-binding NarL/FixJ family response regulator
LLVFILSAKDLNFKVCKIAVTMCFSDVILRPGEYDDAKASIQAVMKMATGYNILLKDLSPKLRQQVETIMKGGTSTSSSSGANKDQKKQDKKDQKKQDKKDQKKRDPPPPVKSNKVPKKTR